jgi:hypothetical protein
VGQTRSLAVGLDGRSEAFAEPVPGVYREPVQGDAERDDDRDDPTIPPP